MKSALSLGLSLEKGLLWCDMNKDVEVRFDEDAYKEYEELQEFVAEGKPSKKKPTYEQLLSSINTAIRNLNNRIPLIWDEWSTVESVVLKNHAIRGILSVKNHLMCRYTQHATRLWRVVFDKLTHILAT